MQATLCPKESARLIAAHSVDVRVDEAGTRKAAEFLFDCVAEPAFGLAAWKALHELHPRTASEEALGWVFLVDTLNFSFWAEYKGQGCAIKYKGKMYTGYWSLCAAVNRALDDGACSLHLLASALLHARRWSPGWWLPHSWVETCSSLAVCPVLSSPRFPTGWRSSEWASHSYGVRNHLAHVAGLN